MFPFEVHPWQLQCGELSPDRIVDMRDPPAFAKAHLHASENVPYHQIPEDLVFESEAAPADVSPAVAASPVAAAPAPAPKPRPKARVAAAATIPCPSCNEPVAEGAARCPKCGQELDWT